jgi:hypothetical protein
MNKQTYRAWAQLTFTAMDAWSEVFPDGKVPIKTVAGQRVGFEWFKDPESVFCVDWDALASWQQDAFLERLECKGSSREELEEKLRVVGFPIGHTQFSFLGLHEVSFWRV